VSERDWQQDPLVVEIRERIGEIDRTVLELVNERIELVVRLWRHKLEHGISFLDQGREDAMLRHLLDENRGPLSEEGLRELYPQVVRLVKAEVARIQAEQQSAAPEPSK
jgi:chorismate mutase